MMDRYNNYHRHSHVSSIFTPDSNAKSEDYARRAIEIGEKNLFTTEHGSGGDIFEAKSVSNKYGLNCKFGIEGYIVKNPLEKDKSNNHIILIPKTNIARRKLNKANSRANIEGFYYRPRLFLDDLLNDFDSNELYITTACCAGLLRNEDTINDIFYPLYEKFGKNLMLEVQTHKQDIQLAVNEKAIKFNKELGLYLIGANDSHYIYPEQYKERAELLRGKGITYDDEDAFILDYPDYETMADRFKQQGILTTHQINKAMENTLIFDECENIEISTEIKMPTIYGELNDDEKIKELKKIVSSKFHSVMSDDDIPKEKQDEYIKEIKKEMQVIEDTKSIHTSDYFLFNIKMLNLALNKYGGVLTRTGRGSCGGYLLNKILGITQIDRIATTLPIYSERFISAERLLENKSMPDIDYNIVEQEPFVLASRELLGENGCYPMIAYGTMKESEAFRNICRSANLVYDEYNEVAKDLDRYKNDDRWKQCIEEANKYIGTIISASVHPCAHLLSNSDIREEIGVLKIGENICAMITSSEADEWKYLKNDYLIVSVWGIISKTYEMLNKPIPTVKELLESLDDNVWDLFANGMTCTLNQVDGDWATKLVGQYKPRSMEELAMFVSSIRPSFESLRHDFIHRKPYTTGSKDLDKLFESTGNRILFQENVMQYFEWLGVSPSTSIGLIKKISKKKIKESDFKNLESRIKSVWIEKTGREDMFAETWSDMQSQMAYSFNSPHGEATALDCLYCAHLKANYPLEYYSVVLNVYQNDEEKTNRLTDEMKYFNINLMPVKFRYSREIYSPVKETNSIYKSLTSIKHINEKVGNELYELRDNQYSSFIDLLKELKDLSINSKQLDILIKLDFFEEMGDIDSLLNQVDIFNKFSSCKSIKLDKWQSYHYNDDIITQCSGKITAKTFAQIDNDKLMQMIIEQYPVGKTSKIQKMKYQIQLLGYTDIVHSKCPNDIFMVLSSEINQYGTPFVKLYQIQSGDTFEIKADKKYWNKGNQLAKLDVIRAVLDTKAKMKKVDDKFVKTGEYERVMKVWGKIK